MIESINIRSFVMLILLSYLFGSIPFAYIAGKIKGIDITKHGSGNVGATNTMRLLGKSWGFFVFFLDALKGFIPAAIFVKLLFNKNNEALELESVYLIAAALFAILGHIYSVWIDFKGGKGAATGFGALLAIIPYIMLISLGIFIIFIILFKYVSLASIMAALSIPVLFLFFESLHEKKEIFIFLLIISLFVVYKHKSNINRLLNGTENKIL
ncbi:MAG: glycerol-3-phosphate 1-O-acyltransferase PlsY [Spirochaetia bacterium]|nr:glycerol-3-phosphate 1-O-acyltransferase PlsY [Spirochaetia bacterium]